MLPICIVSLALAAPLTAAPTAGTSALVGDARWLTLPQSAVPSADLPLSERGRGPGVALAVISGASAATSIVLMGMSVSDHAQNQGGSRPTRAEREAAVQRSNTEFYLSLAAGGLAVIGTVGALVTRRF